MNAPNLRLLGAAAVASLALAGCATSGYGTGTGYSSPYDSSAYGPSAYCRGCGTITRIVPVQTQSAPNATGAVLGGVVGAAAGRELAEDESDGRQNTATVAGAIAGAVAGNAIQNSVQTRYNVYVRLQSGGSTMVTMDSTGGLRVGSYVRVSNGRVYAR